MRSGTGAGLTLHLHKRVGGLRGKKVTSNELLCSWKHYVVVTMMVMLY